MMRSLGLQRAARRAGICSGRRWVSSPAERKWTCWPWAMAASPRAMARCVLPTPGGPRKTTFSSLAMKRRVASSLTKLVHGLDEGEAGHLGAHLHGAGEPAGHLLFQELVQELHVGDLLLSGILGHTVLDCCYAIQLQLPQVLVDTGVGEGLHGYVPTVTRPRASS